MHDVFGINIIMLLKCFLIFFNTFTVCKLYDRSHFIPFILYALFLLIGVRSFIKVHQYLAVFVSVSVYVRINYACIAYSVCMPIKIYDNKHWSSDLKVDLIEKSLNLLVHFVKIYIKSVKIKSFLLKTYCFQ